MLNSLKQILLNNDFQVYTASFKLNILGVRSKSAISNSFDDELHVFWRDDMGKWKHKQYAITTDPGTYWLKQPMMPQGTAILKAGQYVNAYKIGMHQGSI